MAPRRTLCAEVQGRSDHACRAALWPSSPRRKARRAGSRGGGRGLTLAVGLLCSSTAPAPSSAFLVPGGALPPHRRSTGASSMGFGGRRTVGVSSLQSSFAGSPCVAALGQQPGRRSRLARRGGAAAGAGGLRMGIPKLFRWLTDQYPVISQRLDQGLNEVRAFLTFFCRLLYVREVVSHVREHSRHHCPLICFLESVSVGRYSSCYHISACLVCFRRGTGQCYCLCLASARIAIHLAL